MSGEIWDLEHNLNATSMSPQMKRRDTQREIDLGFLADLRKRAKVGKLDTADIDQLYEMERRICGNASN